MQAFAIVFHNERVGEMFVPSFRICENQFSQRCYGIVLAIFQTVLVKEAEPDFHHIQPRTVIRQKMKNDWLILPLQPFAAILSRAQFLRLRGFEAAEFGYSFAQAFIKMRCQIIADIVDLGIFTLFRDMFTKYPNQCRSFMVRRASGEDFSGAVLHDGNQIGRAVTG